MNNKLVRVAIPVREKSKKNQLQFQLVEKKKNVREEILNQSRQTRFQFNCFIFVHVNIYFSE